MQHINEEKAKVMYDFLDSSKMFRGAVDPEFRSLMNIPFVTGDKDLDAEVVAYTKAAGFENLKGHKSVRRPARFHLQCHAEGRRGGPRGMPEEI